MTTSVVSTVRAKLPVGGSVAASGIAPEFGAGLTLRLSVPVEGAKAVGSVGVYVADSGSAPGVANVVVVLAIPLELSVTGAPMAVPPTENTTDPVGAALPLAGATPAVSVTAWPPVAGFGDATSAVVVATAPKVTPRGTHGSAPCWSHAGGNGSVWASVSVPSLLNVGLAHPARIAAVVVGTSAPGTFASCAKPSSTRLIGSAA